MPAGVQGVLKKSRDKSPGPAEVTMRAIEFIKKLQPYNIRKGFRYLRHFGPRQFLVRLSERMEPEEVPYGPWFEAYRPKEEELARQRKRRWKRETLISLAVPVYRTDPDVLAEMIESVLAQTYPYFELCIADGSCEDGPAQKVLGRYAASDPRVRVMRLKKNRGIAGNSNKALGMARGEFVGLLDHDDMLAPDALWRVANLLEREPDTDLIYTDEDKFSDREGQHFSPNLKPDFNPDLLCSNNYICHFLVVRRSLAEEAGGFREEFDGAQDYDLIFRCAERAGKIRHIPEILYHWRTGKGSTADNPLSKTYAYEAGQRAIEEHLARTGTEGRVEQKKDPGFYRVIYPVQGEPLVSIIIPNRDERETLENCLKSIREKSTWKNVEILVIENNSTREDTFAYYSRIDGKDGVRVLHWDAPFNYSAINNFGAANARGDWLLFLNNDTEVITPGWIEEMLGVCQREGTGAVGARLYYPDGTIQHAGIVIGIGGVAGSVFTGMKGDRGGYMHKAELMQDLSAVTAACMMVRKSAFLEVGGFEEKLAVAFNDVDLCLKLREAGYLVVYDPYAELYHYESKTRGAEDTKEKTRRFQEEIEYMRTRWIDLLRDGDPCYNKNLSLSKWNYSLRAEAKKQK